VLEFLYDVSLKKLKHKSQIIYSFDDLHLIELKLNEWVFLEEYSKTMEPLGIALDILQGTNRIFLGYVAPTIPVLRRLLIAITNLKYCI